MPDPQNYTPLDETADWIDDVVELQDGWPPTGGPVDPANNAGLMNWPLVQLASRTSWLKAAVDVLVGAVVSATTTVAGIVRLSTQAEALAGTNADTAMTPLTTAQAIAAKIGAGFSIEAAPISDWNDARNNGWYRSAASSTPNAPGGGWWVGEVVRVSEGANMSVTQTVWSHFADSWTDTICYRRSLNAGVWSAWYRLRISEGEQAALWAAKTRTIAAAGLATGGGNLSADRTITVPVATQAQAEAGTDATTAMTPLATAQALTARLPAALPAALTALAAAARAALSLSDALSATCKTVEDWNSAISTGWYRGAASPTPNAPGEGWYIGEVVRVSDGANMSVTQTVWRLGATDADTQCYRRTYNAGVWSAWYRLRVSEREIKTVIAQEVVAPVRAWVNFDGSGTPTIRAAHNVSSITDLGTGKYRINFATPMQSLNYAVCGMCGTAGAQDDVFVTLGNEENPLTTSYARVAVMDGTGGNYQDAAQVHVMVIGG